MTLTVQADGNILVGGNYRQLGGQSRTNLGRLLTDGSLDAAFRADTDGAIQTMVLQGDGGVIVGGQFTTLAVQPRGNLGRLDASGSVDPLYTAGAGGVVYSLALLPDGRLLAGGAFTTLSGQTRRYLGRLRSNGPATQDVNFDGAILSWAPGGAAPHVSQAFAERWTGTTWTNLGAGVRASGVWRWDTQAPLTSTFRYRGQANGGLDNASAWWLESYGGFPLMLEVPSLLNRNAGESVSVPVRVVGSNPMTYQWIRNGLPLADGPNVAGSSTTNLVLANLACGDAGLLALVVSNASGVVTSQVATLTVRDPFITVQPQSMTAAWGDSATFTVTAEGSSPKAYQWRKAGVSIAGATNSALGLVNIQPAERAGYDVVVSGVCGSVTSIVAYLNQELPVPNGNVRGVAPLPDGRLLVVGYFDAIEGTNRVGIVRLLADGRLDRSFNVVADGSCACLAVQPDGSVVVGGYFTRLGGQTLQALARLRPDGSVDPSFNPDANNAVISLALQPDGRLLVGGGFTIIGGVDRNRIARLNPDGSVDTSFNPGSGANDWVLTLALQPDGQVLLGGYFTTLAGVARANAGRLSTTGALDSFNPAPGWAVDILAVLPDGKILMGGSFSTAAGAPRPKLARLLPSGSLDLSFAPGTNGPSGGTYWVDSLAQQTDGRIIAGGRFAYLGGQARAHLGRLEPNGPLDSSFTVSASDLVYATVLQTDGRIVVGGQFTNLTGIPRARLARVDNTDLASSSLAVEGTSLLWRRDGTSPEVWRTTFDRWSGAGWTNLGAGTRITSGWQLAGVTVGSTDTIRAQGFALGGYGNSCTYLVEEGLGPPVVSIPPVNRTNFLGTTAGLSAWAVGSGPVHYRWRKGGADLTDDGSVSGAGTPNLLLADVQSADAGWYSVVATNALGIVTSAEVYLAVVPLTLRATGPGLGLETNGQFRLELGGGAAWPVSVETSTNLVQWQDAGTPWVGPEPAVFTQPFSNNVPARMHRARPVP
jgi:uncharacterized delta-60 repeat protein